MGGHNAGDFASRYAVNVVRDYIASSSEKNPVKLINEAIRLANKGIIEEAAAHEEMYGMGTTITPIRRMSETAGFISLTTASSRRSQRIIPWLRRWSDSGR